MAEKSVGNYLIPPSAPLLCLSIILDTQGYSVLPFNDDNDNDNGGGDIDNDAQQ